MVSVTFNFECKPETTASILIDIPKRKSIFSSFAPVAISFIPFPKGGQGVFYEEVKCDEISITTNGEISEIGYTRDLRSKKANPFTMKLVERKDRMEFSYSAKDLSFRSLPEPAPGQYNYGGINLFFNDGVTRMSFDNFKFDLFANAYDRTHGSSNKNVRISFNPSYTLTAFNDNLTWPTGTNLYLKDGVFTPYMDGLLEDNFLKQLGPWLILLFSMLLGIAISTIFQILLSETTWNKGK